MKKTVSRIFILLIFTTLTTSCNAQNMNSAISTFTPIPTRGQSTSTPTPNPCAADNIANTVKPVNDLMRQFDDASQLGSNVSRDQAPQVIVEMQRIRRNVEDLEIPPCLEILKQHELAHMNSVIDTMLGFISGADSNAINNSLVKARNEHDQYTLELARLLAYPTKIANPTPPTP